MEVSPTSSLGQTTRQLPKKWTPQTFFRGVLFQMVLFGALSLVGPAMSDAITNLGGGGLSKPWLGNLGQSLTYTLSFFVTILGGPLINKLTIKWACLLAALTMPLHGSSYYVSARYHVDWYLLTASVIKGIGSGFLYVGESTAMLSYPKAEDKGLYLGIWSAMRSSGALIGGAINFGNNSHDSKAGGVAWSTYLIFVGIECTGVIWALLLSPTRRVRRRDGTQVPMSKPLSWLAEFKDLWRTMRMRKILYVALPSFYSFFCGGTYGTYLTLHMSVRSRALSSLLVPCLTIPTVILYGKLLDGQWWTQRGRAWVGFAIWLLPNIAAFIWAGIEWHELGTKKSGLDYGREPHRWAQAYFPYLIVQSTSYWAQLSYYWMLGNFSLDVNEAARTGGIFRAFETAGQAISYGISSTTSIPVRGPFYVNCAALALAIPSTMMLIREMPDGPLTMGEDPAGEAAELDVPEAGKTGVPHDSKSLWRAQGGSGGRGR